MCHNLEANRYPHSADVTPVFARRPQRGCGSRGQLPPAVQLPLTKGNIPSGDTCSTCLPTQMAPTITIVYQLLSLFSGAESD